MLKGLSELKIDRSLLVIYPPLLARFNVSPIWQLTTYIWELFLSFQDCYFKIFADFKIKEYSSASSVIALSRPDIPPCPAASILHFNN